uniref:thrombospondin type 3 repeat-containing protein n=1 Tax=Mariniflexile sp. TaxID=1979402 RepID=UPI0040473C9D
MTVSWTNGNGTGRILIAKANSPVNIEPSDLTYYTYNPNYSYGGNQIGSSGNYVLSQDLGTSVNIYGLQPNTTYYFALFEYNGAGGKVYLTSSSVTNPAPGATASQLTNAYPTNNTSNMTFSGIDGDRFYRLLSSGYYGNGEKRIVVAKAGSPVAQLPVDGKDYTASSTFGSGEELGSLGSGEFVIYDGGGGTNENDYIFGLQPNTTYYFKIFEYNGSGTETFYLKGNDADGDPVFETSQATISSPTVNASNAFIDSKTATSFNLNWTKGDGSGRILIAKANSPVDVEPQDLANYSTNGSFGNGTQIGTGNYVVYQSTGSSTSVSNLQPYNIYHFALFEYNGNSGKVYLRPGYTFEDDTYGVRPTIQSSAAQFDNIGATSMDVRFTSGNGSRRLVIARAGSAVNVEPIDLTTYVADESFESGQEIGTGNFVVFNGTANQFSLNNLNTETTYHLAFFEYGVSQNGELYLAPAYTIAQATPNPPAIISSNLEITPPCNNNVAIVNWDEGNGEGRIVVLSETPLNALPVNATNYIPDFAYGTGSPIGNGFVVFKGSGELVPPNSLQPYTDYQVNIFEYNGTEEDPIFNTTPLQGLVSDFVPPPIMVCQNKTVILDENGMASIVVEDIDNGSSDICAIKTLELDKYNFDCSNIGDVTVTLTATNYYGKSSTCIATVTVIDNINPTITATVDISTTTSADNTGDCDVDVAIPDATINDNCESNLTWKMTGAVIANGTGQIVTYTFPKGVTTITYTNTDAALNTATDVTIVTVTDDEAPTITSVSDFNVNPTSGCDFSIPDYTSLVSTSDNCGVASITQSPIENTVISNHGTIQQIILTVNDVNGNSNSTSFNITLLGTETYYADTDGDSFGNPNNSVLDCSQPTGFVTNNLDCDDTNTNINPNTVWYADFDNDGYGDINDTKTQCEQPLNYVANNTDNCPNMANADQADIDNDGIGDVCDPQNDTDSDGDGVIDVLDNCPLVANPDQADLDNDGIGDACDPQDDTDSDGDGIIDINDNCPDIANA